MYIILQASTSVMLKSQVTNSYIVIHVHQRMKLFLALQKEFCENIPLYPFSVVSIHAPLFHPSILFNVHLDVVNGYTSYTFQLQSCPGAWVLQLVKLLGSQIEILHLYLKKTRNITKTTYSNSMFQRFHSVALSLKRQPARTAWMDLFVVALMEVVPAVKFKRFYCRFYCITELLCDCCPFTFGMPLEISVSYDGEF